jgi:hypothetical protein
MTNRNENLTTGPVELGAPTLTINPPVKPEETAPQAELKEAPNDDAANRNQG